jgi:hypothetical protein
MNKARLDWIISGLNRYRLNEIEDRLMKTTQENFGKHEALTDQQEERLERLYKEKSMHLPDRHEPAPKVTGPKKTRPWKQRGKASP